MSAPDFTFDPSTRTLTLTGSWTLPYYASLKARWAQLPKDAVVRRLQVDGITQLDTSGVLLWLDHLPLAAIRPLLQSTQLSDEWRQLLALALQTAPLPPAIAPPSHQPALALWLARIGRRIGKEYAALLRWLGFLGMVVQTIVRLLVQLRPWRLTSLVAHIDDSGFKATPIIVLLCFMVGAVVAFLGASVLSEFGAQVFTVDLVTYSFLREFAILLVAILLAGRTASAYTAHIGLMKVNEEIDALRAMGSDPIEMLVVPRLWAMMIVLPLLTFMGMCAGILGGMTVSYLLMDISPRLFVDIINNSIHVKHFLVGMSKAPVFAVVIAITGCLEGFLVSGSAASVGRHTTASVVKCIFLVILLDALLAIFFMKMGI